MVEVKEITQCLDEMEGSKTFMKLDSKEGLVPTYADHVDALYVLGEWPLFDEANRKSTDKALQCCAALMPHGKTHVAEVFFFNKRDNIYLGTSSVFSVTLPERRYVEALDDVIISKLSERFFGAEEGADATL